ncbi:MAG: hypothetical protein Q9209_004012 [Squamulea sp. 1 TL-2023]
MASNIRLTDERPINEVREMQIALSPTSPNVVPVNTSRSINQEERPVSTSSSIHNNVADYVACPGHDPSISDLPFRTIKWGKHNESTALTSAYAPTASHATSNSHLATPRFIVPSTATKVPSYVRPASAPAQTKRRTASFPSVLLPIAKVKTQRAQDDNTTSSATPPLTDRRASYPSERLRRRSENFQSWKQKRKDQKLRLKLDGARYGAEQEALFSAHRERQDLVSPRPDVEQMTIKEEATPVESQIVIKEEDGEE